MNPETPLPYLAFFKTVAPGTLPRLRELCTQDVRFRDPFREVAGIEAFIKVFGHMFGMLKDPHFLIRGHAIAGDTCYIRWTLRYQLKKGGAQRALDGMSEVEFAPDGRVKAHFDYFDSGMEIFARLPVLGPVIRLIARRIGA
jgi:ketosteroid isomerase-like protein